jgi:putative ABC transport system permease protein
VSLATWTPIEPAPARFTISPPTASAEVVEPAALTLDLDAGTTAQRQASARFRFVTADAATVSGFTDGTTPVDVLATPQLVEALAAGLDTPVSVRIGGTRLALRIVGETDLVPFAADEPQAFLADHATLATAAYLANGARSDPDRWVLVLDEPDRDEVTTVLRDAPFDSAAVADRWEEAEQRIGDPILVGLTGSLLIAVGAVAVVAIVGLVMAAVTGARDRRGENAVLRALGASRRELRQWLVRETLPIGVLAVVIGLATGVVIASVVSSALTGDRDGGDAVPPPQLVVPWPALAALVGVALVAVALVPLATSRLLHGVRPADELRIGDQR